MDRIPVRDPTDVASARRRIVGLAVRLGYSETEAGRVAIVATELAQNLLRYGGGGEMLAGADAGATGGIEILALDKGPGMADVAACLRDGFSTGGTSGNGLGAVQRMARQMLIHAPPGGGTAVLVRMGGGGTQDRMSAAMCVPKPGEEICGDAACILARPDGTVGLLLADGLGHGPQAAAASQEAVRLFGKHPAASPVDLLTILHAGLRSTRGAALATALIEPAARRVTYGGIGNIAGFITDTGGVRRMVSHSGTAGHTAGRMQAFHYPMHHRPVVVMFSDGLATSWSPDGHAGLFSMDPTLIAAVLYRDHARGRDDASVVVWKG
nr:ATP-binding SpoIIE family protein phosphatase [uncultured Rhodopila sp.]